MVLQDSSTECTWADSHVTPLGVCVGGGGRESVGAVLFCGLLHETGVSPRKALHEHINGLGDGCMKKTRAS